MIPSSSVLGVQSPSLCRTFTAESAKIWYDLGSAWASGRVWDEETITNVLLRDVEQAHPQDVVTVQFYKAQEQFTGADWEWWLTDGKRWLGLLIQAKRLTVDSGKYQGIKHVVGKEKIRQVDLLLEWANYKGLDPLYAFYNYSQAPIRKYQWNCGRKDLTLPLLGCTVAHAAAVKSQLIQGGAGLPKMSQISYPMCCLVCCPALADADGSLPSRVYRIVCRLRNVADQIHGFASERPRTPGTRDEPPDYVRRLLSSSPDDRRHIVEDLRRQVGPIKRLVVIIDHLGE